MLHSVAHLLGKVTSSVGCSVERVASALSSPLVLDKIQSQDDAWRLLQHDEGFIRDWIVANVPDDVIFKLVGAGNGDTNVDNSSIVFSNGNAVVVSSPPKTEDVTMASEPAAITGTAPLPSMSVFLGESASRPTFEQQFLHYLVSKASQDKPAASVEGQGEHSLQVAPDCVEDVAESGHASIMKQEGLMSASSVSSAQGMDQRLVQPLSTSVGDRGDCRIPASAMECPQQPLYVNRVVGMSADGEVSQLATGDVTDPQAHALMTEKTEEIPTQGVQIHTDPHVPWFPSQLDAAGPYSPVHPGSQPSCHPSFIPPHYQQPPAFAPALPRQAPIPRYGHPQRFQYPGTSRVAGACGSYMYPYRYGGHEQCGPQYASVPEGAWPRTFRRYPPYLPFRGQRLGRGRGSAFSYPFRYPQESLWSSKACNTPIDVDEACESVPKPQIKFVQVLRPKSESFSQLEHTGTAVHASVGNVPTETVVAELSATETSEETAAEVAVMKTRDMPHGTQVEDIYVVPQVWLSNGRAPSPPATPENGHCLVCPCSGPSQPAAASCSHNTSLFTTGLEAGHTQAYQQPLPEPERCEEQYASVSETVPTVTVTVPSIPENCDPKGTCSMNETVKVDGLARKSEQVSSTENMQYKDFKPVAVVTTFPVSTTREGTAVTAEPATLQVPSAPLPCVQPSTLASTSASAPGDATWQQDANYPVQDASVMTDSLQKVYRAEHVESTVAVKVEGEMAHKHNAGEENFGSVKFQSSNASESGQSYARACSSSVHYVLESDLARPPMADSHTHPSGDEVEIMETHSTHPSAILFTGQASKEVPPGKKRLRRSLNSEFSNSSLRDYSCAMDNPVVKRPYSRRGRWYRQHYSSTSPYDFHQQSQYPYMYPCGPRLYHYNSGFGMHDAMRYQQPAHMSNYFTQTDLDRDSNFFISQMDEDSIHGQPSMALSYHRGSVQSDTDTVTRDAWPLPHHCRDHPVQLGSSQLDYRDMPCTNTPDTFSLGNRPGSRTDYYGQSAGLNLRSEELSTKPEPRTSRRLRFWPSGGDGSGEGSAAAGEWKIGATGHRIRADELETIQWLLREVWAFLSSPLSRSVSQ